MRLAVDANTLEEFGRIIYDGTNSIIYQIGPPHFEYQVIVKVLKSERPSAHQIQEFQNEYTHTKDLQISGVRKVLGQTKVGARHALILEYIEGETTRDILISKPFCLTTFLRFATQVAQSLNEIHHLHLIHRDLNSNNILIQPNGDATLIDFGIASKLDLKTSHLGNPAHLEGTLAYISPEQTGRMNRVVDYRTDLYSLGVTFYEVLTGRLPFELRDPLELVYAHLAQSPEPPHQLCPEIPEILSKIVLKLMAKNPEERYQSALGLAHDLERVSRLFSPKDEARWQGSVGEGDPILDLAGWQPEPMDFALGQDDFIGRLQIPEILYGRESEIAELLAAFERMTRRKLRHGRVSHGPEMVLVSGYSGIGKSVMIGELQKPITASRGFFISGKYEQMQRTIPYAALTEALNSFCHYLLTESAEVLEQWRSRIEHAIGSNGQLLIDLIPVLGQIIGPQQPVAETPPLEAQNRLNLIFQQFIRAISLPEHPLVLFIDDMQWADSASLSLLNVLMTDSANSHFLFIGAYRDNEVSSSHPLMMTLAELEEKEVWFTRITLGNLAFSDVQILIADSLSISMPAAEGLARLVYDKTHGNPFFTKEFLKMLYQEELLTFDFSSRQWSWELDEIRGKNITENVVELMVQQINRLSNTSQTILPLAACIGSNFDLKTLSIIARATPQETLHQLWESIERGLIVPTDEAYRLVGIERVNPQFAFLHDRVQQAAYSLIEEVRQKDTHLAIGRLLLDNIDPEKILTDIFTIVNHLNEGRLSITDPIERIQLADLNYGVGLAAKESAAYKAALDYFAIGIELLPEDRWAEVHYSLTYALYRERYDSEYINGSAENAQLLFDEIMDFCTRKVDRAEIFNIAVVNLTLLGKYAEAIDLSLLALEELNISFPVTEREPAIALELAAIQQNLGNRPVADLVNMPLITDPLYRQRVKLLTNAMSPAVFIDPELFALITCHTVNLALQLGNAPELPYTYSCYGLILGSNMGQYDVGLEFGKLGIELSAKLKSGTHHCRTLFLFAHAINQWREPLESCIPYARQAYQKGLESGDLQFAGYAYFPIMTSLIYGGHSLSSVLNEIERAGYIAKQTNNQMMFHLHLAYRQFVHNLQGLTFNEETYNDETFDEADFLEAAQADLMSVATFYITKGQALYYYHRYAEALEAMRQAEPLIGVMVGILSTAEHTYYCTLILLALYPTQSEESQRAYLHEIENGYDKLKMWAKNSPTSFQHKLLLVEAEMARILGQEPFEVIDLYDRAIESATEHGFTQIVGLGNELAGRFWLTWEKPRLAKVYLEDARYQFELWGAENKVNQLDRLYAQWLSDPITTHRNGTPADQIETIKTSVNHTSHHYNIGNILDLASIIKASQTLSGEIILDRLIEKLMRVILENAGAQRGMLLIHQGGDWTIEASLTSAEADVDRMQAVPLERMVKHVPVSLVNYVIRTQKSVVLNNAAKEGQYTHDTYVLTHQPKSVLCLPLVHQGIVTAVVYLENNLNSAVFTRERLEVLNLLSTQAAISIENAVLYNSLEQQVVDRTAKLTAVNEQLQQDIQHRLSIEKSLRDSQAYLTQAQSMAQLASWHWEFKTNKVGWSEQILDICGLPASTELDLELYRSLIHPDDVNAVLQTIQETLQGDHHHFSSEHRLVRHRDGCVRTLIAQAQITRSEDRTPVEMIGVVQDITERKRVEELLTEAKDAAEAANRTKSTFLSSMTHELRTPMNGVIGMTTLLLDTALSTDQLDLVNTIRTSGDTLLTIINDILDFSKIEANKLELEAVEFDLSSCIEEALDLIAQPAGAKGLELAYFIPEHVPNILIQDITRLRQILVNLVGNAVKFTDEGEVVVTVEAEELPEGEKNTLEAGSVTTPSRRVKYVVSVKDTGIGIREERLHKLFQSFSQVDASTTRRYGGTGLGLAISKRLSELMGGTMWVESQSGVGSTFFFSIMASVPKDAPSTVRYDRKLLAQKSVLILEGNQTNRHFLQRHLESWEMSSSFLTPEQVVQGPPDQLVPIDLILVDWQQLPQQRLAVQRVLAHYPGVPLIILAMRGHQIPDDLQTEKMRVVYKPTKPALLFDALSSLFHGQHRTVPIAQPTPQFDADMAKKHPLTILLAEDNLVNQKVALRILERLGYMADVAANGFEAIDAVDRRTYDLILMDVNMPEMDGVVATQQIRSKQPPERQPTIIAMTANAIQGDREQYLAAGMNDYVSKPVRVSELVDALRKAKSISQARIVAASVEKS